LSRCKLGSSRVYWVVQVFGEWDTLVAEGYCRTVEEAEHKAKAIAGPDSRQWQAHVAERRHRLKVHEARKGRPSKAGGAQVRRYVYTAHESDYDGTRYVLTHPILKRTEKRVYVSEYYCDPKAIGTEHEPTFHHGPDDRTVVLDRAKLETDGYTFSHSRRWREMFYLHLEEALDPWEYRRRGKAPASPDEGVIEALSVLDLAWPCSEREFRAAYRRMSKQAHPDCGGSAEAFVEVNDAYESIKARVVDWPECA
jgi:hypothetical protein